MNIPLRREKSLVSMKRRKARQDQCMRRAVFLYRKSMKGGSNVEINEELLNELIRMGVDAPVRILAEKDEGLKVQVRSEISGNIAGIFVVSANLFVNITKFIKSEDDDLLGIWASLIVKILGDAVDGGKEDNDED